MPHDSAATERAALILAERDPGARATGGREA